MNSFAIKLCHSNYNLSQQLLCKVPQRPSCYMLFMSRALQNFESCCFLSRVSLNILRILNHDTKTCMQLTI